MKAVRFLFLMSLGGAVWGSLLGIFLGGTLGGLVGAALGDLGLGLDAALFAGAGGCLAGALYGAGLAIWDCCRKADAATVVAPPLADRHVTHEGTRIPTVEHPARPNPGGA